jgi:hypothetical protein
MGDRALRQLARAVAAMVRIREAYDEIDRGRNPPRL